MLRSIHSCLRGLHCIYFFPTRTDVIDFSKSRVGPLLAANPFLRRMMNDTDTAGLKQIRDAYLYLRGMQSTVGMKSVPADLIVFDELDETAPEMKSLARERLSHSEYKWTVELSNPSLPDYGIDAAYQASDQKHWTLKCPGCGEWTALDKAFPTKLGQEVRIILPRPDGTFYRACPRCGAELDLAAGEWVADYPDRPIHGYRISQLISSKMEPGEILREYRMTQYPDRFYNLKIGIAWANLQRRLDVAAVLALCGEEPMRETATDSGRWRSMGVDTGNALHVVVLETDQATGVAKGGDAVWTYDAEHRPLDGRTRRRSRSWSARPGRFRIQFTRQYDDYNRMTNRSAAAYDVPAGTEFYGTTAQSFVYDDLGRMVEAVDHTQSHPDGEDIRVALKYDSIGRRTEENQRLPLNGGFEDHVVSSVYAIDGLRTTLSYPRTYDPSGQELDLYTLAFNSDNRHRLTGITGPTGPQEPAFEALRGSRSLLEYEYVGGRPWSRWQGNFTETRFHDGTESLYDGLGRPTRMLMIDEGNTSTVLPDFEYGYDRVGNRSFEMRRHERMSTGPDKYRTRGFSTDLMDRMVSWREGPIDRDLNPITPNSSDPAALVPSPSDGERWELDRLGNWDQKWTGVTGSESLNDFEINHLNQYASVTPQGGTEEPFTYDWLGQLRSNESRLQTYAWDLFGRLTKVYEAGDPDPVAVYRYDALNRRVEKTDNRDLLIDRTTWFIYDDWRAIEERTIVDGSPDKEVVRARYGFGRGLDEVVWMDRDVDRDGGIESRLFTHQDGQGSTVLITSDRPSSASALQRIEWFEYTAYGQVTSWDGAWSEPEDSYAGTSQNDSRFRLPYLFTGQRLDSESGLMYFKNRYYDPETGRFLQRDPAGYADGPSLYQYARSNPAFYVDPLGLRAKARVQEPPGGQIKEDVVSRLERSADRVKELHAMMDSYNDNRTRKQRAEDSREEKASSDTSDSDNKSEEKVAEDQVAGEPPTVALLQPSSMEGAKYKRSQKNADGDVTVIHYDEDNNVIHEETVRAEDTYIDEVLTVLEGVRAWGEMNEELAQAVELVSEIASRAEVLSAVVTAASPEGTSKVVATLTTGACGAISMTCDRFAFVASPSWARAINVAWGGVTQGTGRTIGYGLRRAGWIRGSVGEAIVDVLNQDLDYLEIISGWFDPDVEEETDDE